MEDIVEDWPRTIGDLIKAREEALRNYLEIRMSNKLRQAILGKTRPTPDEKKLVRQFISSVQKMQDGEVQVLSLTQFEAFRPEKDPKFGFFRPENGPNNHLFTARIS